MYPAGKGGAMGGAYGNRQEDMTQVQARNRHIPFLDGRPERTVSISDDDLLNLIIALNVSRSLEEFFEQV